MAATLRQKGPDPCKKASSSHLAAALEWAGTLDE